MNILSSSAICLSFLLIFLAISAAQQGRRRVVKRIRVKGRARNIPEPAQPARLVCPQPEGLQVYEDPDSCNRFYKCANGTLTHEECANGLLFDQQSAFAGAAHAHCSYNWAVNCGQRRADDTPISTPGCEYQFGLFASGDCSPNYIKCAFGVPADIPCDIGLVFDPRSRSCNWPDQQLELGCDPSQLLGGFECPDPNSLSDLARRFLPFPRFPVDGQPDLYILCVNNLPRLQACGAGSTFDPRTLGCVEF